MPVLGLTQHSPVSHPAKTMEPKIGHLLDQQADSDRELDMLSRKHRHLRACADEQDVSAMACLSEVEEDGRDRFRSRDLSLGQHVRLRPVDSELNALLPPLKRSRVERPRLQSIRELGLPMRLSPCLRCKIQHLGCDPVGLCTSCAGQTNTPDQGFWRAMGCHRVGLDELAHVLMPPNSSQTRIFIRSRQPESVSQPCCRKPGEDAFPTKTAYQRPAVRRLYCGRCEEKPEGFRGEHELRRHRDAKHAALVRRWVCVEPASVEPGSPRPVQALSKCKACVAHKRYGAYYNAAAHLRRAHFRPHHCTKASGDWPPMTVLRDWMREVRQPVLAAAAATQQDELETTAPATAAAPRPGPSGEAREARTETRTETRTEKRADGRMATGRCPHADCGRVLKDLAAHMLTHMEERPEKCPVATCEYHVKGFARRHDKNRHALTHYKGTITCPFCHLDERTFTRTDLLKRHLMAAHGVEQTPPSSRWPVGASVVGYIRGCGDEDEGDARCSICHAHFTAAHEFYEHLDECVLGTMVPGAVAGARAVKEKRQEHGKVIAGDERVQAEREGAGNGVQAMEGAHDCMQATEGADHVLRTESGDRRASVASAASATMDVGQMV